MSKKRDRRGDGERLRQKCAIFFLEVYRQRPMLARIIFFRRSMLYPHQFDAMLFASAYYCVSGYVPPVLRNLRRRFVKCRLLTQESDICIRPNVVIGVMHSNPYFFREPRVSLSSIRFGCKYSLSSKGRIARDAGTPVSATLRRIASQSSGDMVSPKNPYFLRSFVMFLFIKILLTLAIIVFIVFVIKPNKQLDFTSQRKMP